MKSNINKKKHGKNRIRNIVITIALVIVAGLCLTTAGLTLAGVNVVNEVKEFFTPKVPATAIDFQNNQVTLGVGQSSDLKIILTPKNSTDSYEFYSTNEKVVTAKGNKVTAVSEGSCTVKVVTENKLSAYCDITVTPAPESVTIPSELKVAISEVYQFDPITQDDISSDSFTYTSSDENIAMVDDKGQVTPISTGTATITVNSYNGLSCESKITICETPTSFTLSDGGVAVYEDSVFTLEADFPDGYGASTMTFKSDNDNVATVDKDGNVTGVKKGTANITCTLFNNITATCKVMVNDKMDRIRKGLDSSKPMVALTFDDGPNKNSTKKILNTLKKYHGRATFFVVGTRVQQESDILKTAYDNGNEIGSHSWDHSYADDLTAQEQLEEITKTNKVIYDSIGAFPTLFRCPGGISSEIYEKKSNMPLIMWSIDTEDWKTKNSNSTYNSIKKVFKKNENLDGDIVLMHDIQNSTPKAVEKICKLLSKKNYQLVTVSELAYYKGYDLENGETYSSFYK
jgi:peptidoglycan/xylan/chitin deacetylase (PgdA/CDA1 family)